MTADTTAATGTVDTTATTATTTDAATGSTTPPGSGDAPQTTTTDTTTTTTTDGAKPDGEKPDGDKPKEGEAAVVPEAYEFVMPEGVALDQALADRATPIFKELQLTQEQGQKLAVMFSEHVQAQREGATEAVEAWYADRKATEIAEQSTAWLDATKADKEIGGANFDPVKSRVMDAVGAVATPEAKEAFNKLGWGNHPELIRLVNRLIDYTPQDKGERPAGAGGQSLGAVMFDHPTSRPKQ